MKLLCRVLGHRWHPEGAEFYCVYDCMRCDYHGNGDEYGWRGWVAGKLWRFNYWGKSYQWGFWWAFKCTECGKRFGRHDDSFDHLPF